MIRNAPGHAVVPWQLPLPDALSMNAAYHEALSAIYSYSERPRDPRAVRLGRDRKIQRMRSMLGLVGSPQARFDTILVAGTKGKGSMAALIASILDCAGYRVGRYTQPHLYSHRERIWVNGAFISEDEIVDGYQRLRLALDLVERAVDELGPLTTFDVGTLMALEHFGRRQVEIAVVEVGVGGANDATNALEPVLALIGPIGIDHADTLGSTLAAIAGHKAGVMRRGRDVIVSRQEAEAELVLRQAAREAGAHLLRLGTELRWETAPSGSFCVEGPTFRVGDLTTPLRGRCQRDNAALAVAAAMSLNRAGRSVGESHIREGLASVSWPGRFQTVVEDPTTIVDGAHNPAAMRALLETVEEVLPGRPITLVVGMAAEKDVAASLSELAPRMGHVIATRARHPRSARPELVADCARALGLSAEVIADPSDAVRASWAGSPSDGVTLVAGSLFLAGDVLEWLLRSGRASSHDQDRAS